MSDIYRHFNQVVKKTTSHLIRTIVNKKVFNASRPIDLEKLEQCLTDFKELMLRYEAQLKSQPYLTGSQMTFVDIVIFIEIETVLLMYRSELPEQCRNMLVWQDTMSKLPALMSVNSEFLRLVQDWDLYAPNQ